MNSDNPTGPDDRSHNEAPAEGDTSENSADTRAHAEQPAEGEDASEVNGGQDQQDDDGRKGGR